MSLQICVKTDAECMNMTCFMKCPYKMVWRRDATIRTLVNNFNTKKQKERKTSDTTK